MSCIKTLKHFYRDGNTYAGTILHDIQFWAGAYVSDPNKTSDERLKHAFQCNVVNGRIANFHSYKDTVIKYLFTQVHPGHRPIGLEPMLLDVAEDEDGKIGCKKAINVDVTKEAGGHSQYKEGGYIFIPMT
jgi:GNAT superfamily N-acetyltransferase